MKKHTTEECSGFPEKCWRVDDFAEWLGVCTKNIYNHISDGSINKEAYRKWGNLLIFLPWRCRELLAMDALFLRYSAERKSWRSQSKNRPLK